MSIKSVPMDAAAINSATAEIDLAAIANNFAMARSAAPQSKIMAVIKADAYGHGIISVAKCLVSADAFGVARMEEAIALREAGIQNPVTLLEGVLDGKELEMARNYGLDLVVHSDHQLSMLVKETGFRLWLKLDTGMHRLGVPCEALGASLSLLAEHKVLGVMGHFSDADQKESSLVAEQLHRFLKATASVDYDRSLANSAAILAYPKTHAEWVRPGLMLYGATPFADLEPIAKLTPAMSLFAPIVAIKALQEGDAVGYGSLWVAEKRCRIAVVAIGYGDGYPREVAMGTAVLINGKRRRLVGRVSMDMLTVELLDEDDISIGDRVELWGKNLPIEEISVSAGTIPYTLMCGVSIRVRRDYIR